MRVSSDWFSGEGHDADHQAFLTRLRDRARHDGLEDAEPGDTQVLIASPSTRDVVVGVRAPGLPTTGPEPLLQAGFARDDQGIPYLMGAWESFGFVLDPPTFWEPADPGASPSDLADRVFEWLTEQLRRPVELWEFPALLGRAQKHWRFADTGELLCRSGGWFRRGRRPLQVLRVRGHL